ncbi:MAG: polyphenol oxidase family protein [Chloroherpetonaceae bacterium]|nr:polyphenol oxidase family protein [Chthonomonadaceae bacterium]MDW8206635.1 polyphenol oxidase family protein [Chloroherpetonaceae bacterium]
MEWRLISGMRPLLQYEPLAAQGVVCAITTRTAADTEGNYSFHVTRDVASVRANRRAACQTLGFDICDLIVPQMTHGANVARVDASYRGHGDSADSNLLPDCDALITNTPGILLGITVADCLPVFLYDPVRQAMGLVHAGWRGTAAGIVLRTLQCLRREFHCHVRDIHVVIGPGIGGEAYEVDMPVRAAFPEDLVRVPGVFRSARPGHWRLDLTAAVCYQLHREGVPGTRITVCPMKTSTHPEWFYSHRAVPGCPRMLALLGRR